MDSAIVFTYGRPHPGREAKAFEAFTEALQFFGEQEAAGECGHASVFIGASGVSHMILPGDRHRLSELVHTDRFQEIYLKATFAAPDIGYEFGAYDEGAQEQMMRWARVGGELALM